MRTKIEQKLIASLTQFIDVTLLTSHCRRSWLNLLALLNISFIEVVPDTSHSPMSSLNLLAPVNILSAFLRLEVFQALSGRLKDEA